MTVGKLKVLLEEYKFEDRADVLIYVSHDSSIEVFPLETVGVHTPDLEDRTYPNMLILYCEDTE